MGNSGSSNATSSLFITTPGHSPAAYVYSSSDGPGNNAVWSSASPSPAYLDVSAPSASPHNPQLFQDSAAATATADPFVSLLMGAIGSTPSWGSPSLVDSLLPGAADDDRAFGRVVSDPRTSGMRVDIGTSAEKNGGGQSAAFGSAFGSSSSVPIIAHHQAEPISPPPRSALLGGVNDGAQVVVLRNATQQLMTAAYWHMALNGSLSSSMMGRPLPATPSPSYPDVRATSSTNALSILMTSSIPRQQQDVSDNEQPQGLLNRPHNPARSRQVAQHVIASAPPQDPTATVEAQVTIATYSIIFFLSFVGNALVLVTLGLNRRLRSVTNLFLLNLAVADLLLGVLCMPATLVGSLLRDFVFGAGMCKIIPYLQAVSVSVGVWTLVAISLERYFAICRPLTSRTWQTRSHAYKVIFFVWSVAFLVSSPIAVMSRLIPIKDTGRHKCREVWPEPISEKVFNVFLLLGFLLVPLVVMSAMYSLIAAKLWTGMRREQRHSSDVDHRRGGAAGGQGAAGPSAAASTAGTPARRVNDGETIVSGYDFPLNGTIYATKRCLVVRWKPTQHSSNGCGTPGGGDVSIMGLTTNGANNNAVGCCTPDDPSSTGPSGRGGLGRFSPQPPSAATCKLYSAHPIRNHNAERSIQSKRKVIQMLFVIVLEFFVCWVPLYVMNTWALFDAASVYKTLGPLGVNMIQLLAYLSSCCNPITYCFMHRKFRRAFWESIRCRKCAAPQQPAHYRQNSFSLASAPEYARTTSIANNGRNYIVGGSNRATTTTTTTTTAGPGFAATVRMEMTGVEDHEV